MDIDATRYDCVLPSPDGTRFLLVRDDDRWTLPFVLSSRGWLAETVEEVVTSFRERYGVEITVLRILQWLPSLVTCELEAHLGDIVAGALWVQADDAIVESLPVEQAIGIRNWSADRGHELHLSPWQRRGWLAEAREWIAARVPAVAIVPVKAGWNGSCVLRVETATETYFFKASRLRTPSEATVIRTLAEWWPRNVPHVVGVDDRRNWMLMRELRGTPLHSWDEQDLADVARLVARMQIEQAAHAPRWLQLGCPDRGQRALEESLETIMLDLPRRLRDSGAITESQRAALATIDAARMSRELASYALPPLSIIHEDFRDGNVLRGPDGNLTLIDWNEIVLAHPFFMLQRFLWYMAPPPGVTRHHIAGTHEDRHRRTLRDAYLDEFTAFEPLQRLREAFLLSSRLAPVHDAYRLTAAASLDDVFARGLGPQEQRFARQLMEQILEAGADW